MDILIKQNPNHLTLKDGTALIRLPDIQERLEYRHGLDIPHFLNFKDGGICTAIVPTVMAIEVGDILHTEYGQWCGAVTEIIERRKARGTWENNPYDNRPDWVKIRFV